MIAFGSAVSDEAIFERVALPGIRQVIEPDSVVLTRVGYDSIQRPYNEMLDEAAARDDLEALVLLHQDLELLDDSLLRRARAALRDPRVGVVGLFGGRRAPLTCWTDAGRLFGREMSPTSSIHHSAGSHEVEIVDGSLLVLAPWVVRTVRFSEALASDFHGYDFDFCLRVRALGGRVVCSDAPYFHHMRRPWSDAGALRRALGTLVSMWDPEHRPREWAGSFAR
jgi:hypothetical protein